MLTDKIRYLVKKSKYLMPIMVDVASNHEAPDSKAQSIQERRDIDPN